MQKFHNNITKNQSPVVSIGTKVLIEVNGEQQEWEIVNVNQSDIPNRKISYQAPLIQCILGVKEDDKINCRLTDEVVTITVKKIESI